MNVDPLADTVPPRHAYESDDEDEAYALPLRAQPAPELALKIAGAPPTQRPLMIATGTAGAAWGRGAALGEQTGGVYANGVLVGLLFGPAWAGGASVLVSEATARLPVWAMHAYAEHVLQALLPTRIGMLDTYSVPAYISRVPILAHEAPVRYLSSADAPEDASIVPFAPPNLLQSTSAAFLSLAALPPHTGTAPTLLLVPAPTIPAPPPAQIEHTNVDFAHGPQWPTDTMRAVSRALFAAAGVQARNFVWEDAATPVVQAKTKARRGDVGDGGMYI